MSIAAESGGYLEASQGWSRTRSLPATRFWCKGGARSACKSPVGSTHIRATEVLMHDTRRSIEVVGFVSGVHNIFSEARKHAEKPSSGVDDGRQDGGLMDRGH